MAMAGPEIERLITEAFPDAQVVVVDLAGDGDLDIVYNNYEGPPTLIRNHTCDGHRVMIKLAGRAPNLDAIGADLFQLIVLPLKLAGRDASPVRAVAIV